MSQNLHDDPQPRGPVPQFASPAPASPSSGLPSPSLTSPDRPLSRPGEAYSPPPSSVQGSAAPPGANRTWRVAGIAILAAAGIVGGAWYAFSGVGKTAPEPVPVVESSAKTLRVAAVDADAKATEQLKNLLSGAASSADAAAADFGALNAAGLKSLATSSPKMAEEIKSGRRVLYRVYLLDFLAEDGDHVELSINGVSLGDTTLKGAGTSFLFPLEPGVPARLKVLATADGGGGVTVGFVSSLGEARTQIMQVGQFDEWQVIAQ